MKSVVSIICLFILFAQIILQTGYVIYWKMNQQQITVTSCINKNKPRSTCNGKCQLLAQLKKIQRSEDAKHKATSKIKFEEIDAFVIEKYVELNSTIGSDVFENNFYRSRSTLYRFQLITSLLKPPCFDVAV